MLKPTCLSVSRFSEFGLKCIQCICLFENHERLICWCKKTSLFSSKHSQHKLTFQAFLYQAFSHLFVLSQKFLQLHATVLLLCIRSSCDKAFSVSPQHFETMSQACVAELTPLSSCQSYKGTSVDSSHCHLGTTEMLSLRRSDTLPQKLLGHLAEGGGANSLSPFMLRFSGAGFAHYAPGPETSVWSGAQPL